jgi:hypothetical protein
MVRFLLSLGLTRESNAHRVLPSGMTYGLGNRRHGVERLRWQLIFALSGVGAVTASCSGRSSRTVDDDGTGGTSNAGRMNASAGKGGIGAGGTPSPAGGGGGTTGGAGGSGGKGGAGGAGGAVMMTGGASGIGGGAGAVMGGTGGASGEGGLGGSSPACNPATGGQVGLCDGSFVHRPEPATCMLSEHVGPGGQGGSPGAAGAASTAIACESDDDCTEAENGYCYREEIQILSQQCVYACAVDSDCGEGAVCSCDNSYVSAVTLQPLAIGRCVLASCRTDADCEPGRLCIAPVDSSCGPRRAIAYHCQTPNDECAGPDDCVGTYRQCEYTTDRFSCQDKGACGRPFLVEGAVRQSQLAAGSDWQAEELASALPVALSRETREVIAAHFAEAGLMEHASIAAFARFSLQLLALGAPPELVRACTEAMADETRHARQCFGLAARYAGRSFAPGRLDVTGALGEVTLRDVLELVVREGCIGETAAALEATWAADAATDPVVREVLCGIAEDEGRHAALAFRFVAWAIAREPVLGEVLERLLAEAQGATAPLVAPSDGAPAESALAAHGVLSRATRLAARRAALFDVLPGVMETALRSARRAPAEDQERQERRAGLTGLAELD